MSDDKTRELLEQIYQLPRTDRAQIAIETAASLDYGDDPTDEGLVEGVPWEQALARIRANLVQRSPGPMNWIGWRKPWPSSEPLSSQRIR